MAKGQDFTAALAETRSSNFARAIGIDEKKLRSYLRRIGHRSSEVPVLPREVQLQAIEHFHGEDAVPADKPKGKKAKA